MQSKEKYFNAPIELYAGFMKDSETVLHNVLCYALFEWTQKHDVRFSGALKFFNVTSGRPKYLEDTGKRLYFDFAKTNPPMTGITTSVYWRFRENEESSDLDKLSLLAYLAMKSIVGSKSYMKINNAFLLSRMDGKRKTVQPDQLSEDLQPYSKRYWLDKIKSELQESWHVSIYSKNMRGYLVSFDLNPFELAHAALKRSLEKKQSLKAAQDLAYQKAMDVISGKLPYSSLTKRSEPVPVASVPDSQEQVDDMPF